MSALAILFWLALVVVAYTYLGYGVLVWALLRRRAAGQSRSVTTSDEKGTDRFAPTVTLVIAAYNEADVAIEKAINSLALDYPRTLMRVLFVTDGSTDGTPFLLQKIEGVDVTHEPTRGGKVAAINRAMRQVQSSIVVFSDANTQLNRDAIRNIVRHYQDPSVGGVAGEKRVVVQADTGAATEGIYWKYESALKRLDSELNTVVGAAGELFSMRTCLFRSLEPDTILDDFLLALRMAAQGMRVVYEPEAYAVEGPSAGVEEELKRKIRICAGGFQAMVRLRSVLNPLQHAMLTFQYVSHRVLRWTLAPALLPFLLVVNVALVIFGAGVIWPWILALQLLFYGSAVIGWRRRNAESPFPGFFVPMYFCVMNVAVYLGFLRYLRGSQSQSWERATRAAFNPPHLSTEGDHRWADNSQCA